MKTVKKFAIAVCIFGFLFVPRTRASDADATTILESNGEPASSTEGSIIPSAGNCDADEKGNATIETPIAAAEVNETRTDMILQLITILSGKWPTCINAAIITTQDPYTPTQATIIPTEESHTQPEPGQGASRRRRETRDSLRVTAVANTDGNGNLCFTVTLSCMTNEEAAQCIYSSLPEIAAAWNITEIPLEVIPGSHPRASTGNTVLSLMGTTDGAVSADVTEVTRVITAASDGPVVESSEQPTTSAAPRARPTGDPNLIIGVKLNDTQKQLLREFLREALRNFGKSPTPITTTASYTTHSQISIQRRRRREIRTGCDDSDVQVHVDENGSLALNVSCSNMTPDESAEYLRTHLSEIAAVLGISVEQLVVVQRSTTRTSVGAGSGHGN